MPADVFGADVQKTLPLRGHEGIGGRVQSIGLEMKMAMRIVAAKKKPARAIMARPPQKKMTAAAGLQIVAGGIGGATSQLDDHRFIRKRRPANASQPIRPNRT